MEKTKHNPQTFIPRKVSLEIYNIQTDTTNQNFYVLNIKNIQIIMLTALKKKIHIFSGFLL